MKMKNILAPALLTALIAGFAQAEESPGEKEEQPSGQAFVELMGGYPTSSLDITAYANLTEKLYLTARGRATVQYEEGTTASVDPFFLGSASFNVVDGFGLRLETYYAAETWRPSIGVEYMGAFGPVNLLGIVTLALPSTDVEFVFIGSYAPPLTDRLSAYISVEAVTNIGENHNFSEQRPRLGVCIDNICFGAGANLLEVGNEGNFSYSVGAFALASF